MISYWSILLGLTLIEAVLVSWFLLIVWKIRKMGPIGIRLAGISIIFILQTILSFWTYIYWMEEGYGKDLAGPLIIYHLLIISGIALLLDIVRK
ncbi:hypothetical protein Smar_0568 [Staphylothermus marinus F1]|uniref:Uncharacterized protein n=1 Tax=Staphylothermus marinus (strain ATCC 43588 / DSM 3639 / JCM 9404 / F1) TaxID=399550 RepID=A3DM15_STAMF|nr:hypothetical protein [Staphylothermus marinus]ABN69675.1 hypothetical protein Smar_0568 [Staphylothermus marinus F1]